MSNHDKVFIPVIILLFTVAVFVGTRQPRPNPKPVDTCPKYLTIKSVHTRYAGAWAGYVTDIVMADGSTYTGNQKHYISEKICVKDLGKL